MTSVGNAPATVVSSQTFSVSDTTNNNGTASAGASGTYFYVSLDGAHIAPNTKQLGHRDIPALASGASSTGTSTLMVPGGTPQGTYYVLACADRLNAVTETNEANNCTPSTSTFAYTAPDLTEGSVSVTPAQVGIGQDITVSDTVTNGTAATAGASTTRYIISKDGTTTFGWIRACTSMGVIPQRNIPSLVGGATNTGTSSFHCYHNATTNTYGNIPPGTYYILACADDLAAVSEVDETNNCTKTATTFQVLSAVCGNGIVETGEACDDHNTMSGDGCSATCQLETPPDLTETAVSDPPASTSTNATFTINDTVQNISSGGGGGTSVTKFYLSTDTVKSGGDYLMGGSRSVPQLNAGATSAGTTTVTVPSAPAGSYYVIACADANATVTESNETNNCKASTNKTTISGADLVVSAVSNPPASAAIGASFPITDTTANIGSGGAVASVTYFYLSLDKVHQATGTTASGTRSVPALSAGASSMGTTNVQIKAGTPAGTYYILACADRTSVVAETNENNNCTSSTTAVSVGGADLVTSNVNFAPASARSGGTITVGDTTTNPTMTAVTVTTTTRYFVSANTARDSADKMLRFCSSGLDVKRSVPPLAAGASSTGTVSADLCYNDGTAQMAGTLRPIPAGTYYILACADDGDRVAETSETNNCSASPTQITVTP